VPIPSTSSGGHEDLLQGNEHAERGKPSSTQNILKYAIGSLDEKITYRPTDANDPFGGYSYGLMAFTDSDWATSVDTRRSNGCYIVMLAGGCIAHRSKAHKSVMLSSAAAEYYEASEGCRELIYIREILEDFHGEPLPPTPMRESVVYWYSI
jgi:hypothetical protein